MTQTKPTQVIIIGIVLLLNIHATAWAAPPPEPNEDYLVNEDINIITGLYTREYSLKGDGVIDYKTARQIVLSEYNEYWNSVVETKEFPLFYWYDQDDDGEYDVWVDQKVEGCQCDMVRYHVEDPNEPVSRQLTFP